MDETRDTRVAAELFVISPLSPVEFTSLAKLVLPLVEAGNAQSVVGRNIIAQHLFVFSTRIVIVILRVM